MNARRPFALYALTRHGLAVADRLRAQLLGADLYASARLADHPAGALPLPLPLGPALSRTFAAYDCHVFVVSIGAVVRLIAPLLGDKKHDPAVVCVDDAARWAVCVLSGHSGGGNALAGRVAAALGAQAVVTTASDARGTFPVDILGRELGWTLDDPDRNVTRGCAAVVDEAPVAFVHECGDPGFWPEERPWPAAVRYATRLEDVDPGGYEILLVASDREFRATHPRHWENAVVYRPRSLVLGIGCDRGTPAALLARGVEAALAGAALSSAAVKAVATIDLKADEPGLRAFCAERRWPLLTFPAAALDAVPAPTPSEVVRRHVGARGVAEPAALLGAGGGALVVNKHRYTEPGAGRSMTVAVARAPFAPRRHVHHG